MRLSDIENQLMTTLPRLTDRLSKTLDINSMSVSGSIVTVVTNGNHRLSVGNQVLLDNILVANPVSTVTPVGTNQIEIETENPHDITESGIANSDRPTATLRGADQEEYNGMFDVARVPNRNTALLNLRGAAQEQPSGNIELVELRVDGYIGTQEVLSVIDATTFTFDLGQTPHGDPVVTSASKISYDWNVLGVVDFETALREYTERAAQEWFIFVELGQALTSRSRELNTDFANSFGANTNRRIFVIRPFTVYLVIPSADDLGGAASVDAAEDFAPFVYFALQGWQVPSSTQTSSDQLVSLVSHETEVYSSSLYVHRFDFEGREDIGIADSWNQLTRAFRNVIINQLNDNDQVIAQATVNLDEDD